ncbi:hypothetical protein [Nocardioides solisilvae]|uniref:hypothetical protein n=1 Tax=Nocardioides solisilvae TaxID=1542435 RepID=UPI000D746AFD|nr:hypothetical protein [Nocardioides solisilvae]
MTTETMQDHRDPGLGVLLQAALAACALGLLVVAVAAAAGGREAALGAATGAGSVLTVLVLGSFVVHVVAHAMPSASLLVALLTYGLQLVVLTAVLTSFDRSGALGETLHPQWLVGGVVTVVVAWVCAQVWLGSRARVLLYDVRPALPSGREEAGAR